MSVPEQPQHPGSHVSRLPSVSVALCVYNGERYLEQQVESLFHQSRGPDEIVAVDDASSDRSFAILQALAQRSAIPMRVHRNETNLGYRRNFERAMSLTRRSSVRMSLAWPSSTCQSMSRHSLPFLRRTRLLPLT